MCARGICVVYSIFFFKQKTAYEMRISDWSSDVCSSDLKQHIPADAKTGYATACPVPAEFHGRRHRRQCRTTPTYRRRQLAGDCFRDDRLRIQIGRPSGRARVCTYVSISVDGVYFTKKERILERNKMQP